MKKIISCLMAFMMIATGVFTAGVTPVSATSDTGTDAIFAEKQHVKYYGEDRYATALKIADGLKTSLGTEKFDNIIIAYGGNYPDALTGSYLAKVKNAPIVLVSKTTEKKVIEYVKGSLKEGGTAYILGGTGVISHMFEKNLKESIDVNRLAGDDRYETNIEILKEAGVTNEDILVCTGNGFADSLSASAVGKPILLVANKLNNKQKAYLETLSSENYCLIGGTGVLSKKVYDTFGTYGNVNRVAGEDRYETSIAVAKAFFPSDVKTVTLAYGLNFPDGLSGAPLSMSLDAPLILTANMASAYEKTSAFTKDELKANYAVSYGGATILSDATAERHIVKIEQETPDEPDTPDDPQPPVPDDPITLGAPVVKIAAEGGIRISVSWNKVDGADGYQVYKAESASSEFGYIGTTKDLYFMDEDVKKDKTYYYKVRAYVKDGEMVYGDYSNVVSLSLKAAEEDSKDEWTDCYLEYNREGNMNKATRIHIGQKWTDELNAALNGGEKIEKLLTRENKNNHRGPEDVYVYDTEDFDNFLIVYVKEGEIIGWLTTADNMGVYKGTALIQGKASSSYPDYDKWMNSIEGGPYVPDAEIAAANIKIGQLYFGGITRPMRELDLECSSNLRAEELLCEYTINALRVMNGKNILEHNEYLYGNEDEYGMKAWAKTMAVSDSVTHGTLSEGPLAGKDMSQRGSDIIAVSNKMIFPGNENVGGGSSGELIADRWYRSLGHSQNLMISGGIGPDYEDTDIHAVGAYKTEENTSAYWAWTNGYVKIDFGMVAPTVTVTEVTDTTATIEWTDTVSQFTEECWYKDELSKVPDFSKVEDRGSGYLHSYKYRKLEPNTTYYVRICAERQMDGFVVGSDWSEVISFTTLPQTEE